MPNIPGLTGYNQPNTFSRIRTLQRAVSVPGGLRVLCIIGEGQREEVLVSSALGNGQDGLNSSFTSSTGAVGRYFKTSLTSLISNRISLSKNGSTLRIVEDTIDSQSFSSQYDARIEIATGKIELQSASLADQGGKLYKASSGNVGDGYLSTPTLTDSNAPAEIWTIRCTSVIRDSYSAPIRGQSSFIASGSVSGQLSDDYGQPFVWRSDGVAVDNGIISFAIFNPTGQVFEVGDKFTIEVDSQVLQKDDSLTIQYIAQSDLNDPESFTDPNDLFKKHGQPSTSNALSLGAQMAFENGATSVLAVQAKPPLPRRTNEVVLVAKDTTTGLGGASGGNDPDDLIFDIEAPGKPEQGTPVHLFIQNVDGTETQIFPNRVDFYDPDITAAFALYENSQADALLQSRFMDPAQTGIPYAYTVVSDDKIEQEGSDGYLNPSGVSKAIFQSSSIQLTSNDLGKELDFITSTVNEGRFEITSIISATSAEVTRVSGNFVSETSIKWQLLSASSESQRILLTKDLALAAGQGLRITYIDQRDDDFFDANWADVLDELEKVDAQILVPLPNQTFSAIQQAFRVHVERMSSTYFRKERLLFTGALEGLTPSQVLGNTLAAPEDIGILEGIQGDDAEEILDGNIEDLANYGVANSFGTSFRVVYFYPDQIVRVINGTRQVIPGYYIAAAAGGHTAGSTNIIEPLTFKTLVGFTILNSKIFTQTTLNNLGDNGITVVEPIIGGGRILHGKTTTQSGAAEEEEISIVFIRDQIARTMRSSYRAFIGKPEDPNLIATLTARAIGLLGEFLSKNYITDFRNLSITRDPVEPRQYNIRVEVQPNYPVNWIFIDVSVGLL